MSNFAEAVLKAAPQASRSVAELFAAYAKREGLSRLELCALVANCIVETGNLTPKRESLNYDPAGLQRTWPTRFSPELAFELGRGGKHRTAQLERIADVVYGDRMGNQGEEDAWDYRGGGLIQVTGKDHYRSLGSLLGVPLEQTPELLSRDVGVSVRAAIAYWIQNNLGNTLIQYGPYGVGNKINTGSPTRKAHGSAQRVSLYNQLKDTNFDY